MKLINKSAILFPEIFIQPACIKHLFCDIRLLFPQATIICIEIYITILQQLSDDLLSVFPSFLFDTFLHALRLNTIRFYIILKPSDVLQDG